MKLKDKPALPATLFKGQELGDGSANGMTLREYYAGLAMQSLIATTEDCMDSNFIADKAIEYAEQLIYLLEDFPFTEKTGGKDE